ncbi:adhesion G protein-coupled receptor L3-like [Ylistrum balloti]|uniref:adhesion G protein-coupled receptor L3-like n=1 Tax=Ylistrum balloti TaxID=509963 RepID=UPI002905CCF2|nr:adhesion G protein-coupled receptor L3-like [Ylistrum balloti]
MVKQVMYLTLISLNVPRGEPTKTVTEGRNRLPRRSVPSPPTNVTVLERQTTSVVLKVTPGAGQHDTFCAEYFNMSHPDLMTKICNDSVLLSLTGLQPGTSYNVSVYTIANNQRNPESMFDGILISTLPSDPQKLTILEYTSTSIDLQVTPGIGSYDGFKLIYFSTQHPAKYVQMTYSNQNISIESLDAGSTYNISVFTLSNNIQSAVSIFAGKLVLTLPASPSSVVVTARTNTSLNITINPGEGAHDELLVVYSGAGISRQYAVNTTEGSWTFFLGELQPETVYNISAFAIANNQRSMAYVVPRNVSWTDPTIDSQVTVTTSEGLLFNVTMQDEKLDDVCPISGYVNGPSMAIEGSTVQFLAIFSVDRECLSSSSLDEIEWFINDINITNKSSSRVQIQSNYTQAEIPWSYLTFRDLSVLDQKPLRACYLGRCFTKSAIEIQLLPKVMLDPISVSVEVGGRINLTCTITEYDEIYDLEFTWTFRGITQSNKSSLPGLQSTQNSTSILQLRNITKQDSGNYTCAVMLFNINSTTIKGNSTSFLSVIADGEEACPSITDKSGLMWSVTPVGHTQILVCPSSFTGTATKTCGEDGLWTKTNLINCVRKEIDAALQQINGIKEGLVDASEIHNVLYSMENVTTTSNFKIHALSSGDLSKTSVVLSALVDVIDESKAPPNLTQNFVNIIDNILSPVNQHTWTDVNKESSTTDASSLMETVEKLGHTVGKHVNIDSPIAIEGNNIAVEIRRVQNHDILSRPKISKSRSNFQHEIALNLGTGFKGDVTFTSALYATISTILPNNDNVISGYPSELLALSVINGYSSHGNLPFNVSLKFDTKTLRSHNNLTGDVNISCVFWNFNETFGPIGWSDDGCMWSAEKKTCICNHLTNFAVLMSPIEITNELDIARLQVITIAGCSLSIASTIITMVVYIMLWRYIKNDRSKLVMNLCVAVTVAYILFLVGLDHTDNNVICTVITAFLHFFFLAIFCLMLADGIQLLRRTTVVMNVKSRLKWLLLIGWGLPVIIVGITIGVKHNGGYHSTKYCWLTITDGVIYSFVGPVLAVIVVNVIVMVLVLKALLTSQFIMTKTQRQKIVSAIRSVCVLLPVLGITWFFGILSINDDTIVFQYLFAVSNSLQGFFIFLFHCVFSVPVRRAMKQKYKKADSASKSNKSQATSTTHSSRYSVDNVIVYENRKKYGNVTMK